MHVCRFEPCCAANNKEKLLNRDVDLLETVITRCCEIKAEIVAMDERESGTRAVLNFGHTLGHAVETTSGYGELLHGEAVAAGMVYAANVSVKEKGLHVDDYNRLVTLLNDLKLSTDWQKLKE